MCLIIHKPAGRVLCEGFLEDALRHNPDGWGLARLQAGQLRLCRGLEPRALLDAHAQLEVHEEVYLHLRKATSGEVSAAMAHPFVVLPGLALMHNGTLQDLCPDSGPMSDTAVLARHLADVIGPVPRDLRAAYIRSSGFRALMALAVRDSFVLLLDAQGAVRYGRPWHVIEPGQWHERMHGVAVSNLRYWSVGGPAPIRA